MRYMLFEISPGARSTWQSLPGSVRRHVELLPGGAASTEGFWTPRFAMASLPWTTFSTRRSIEDVGRLLSTAFPGLLRRVVDVAVGRRIVVRLECEGQHKGMWQGFVCPTGRRVAFDERHEVRVSGTRIVADRMTLDLHAILAQLCGSNRVDNPPMTAWWAPAKAAMRS